MSPRLRLGLRISTAVALLALVLVRTGRGGAEALPLGAALIAVPLVALVIALGQGVAAARWRVVIGPGAPPWRYLGRLYFIGGFLSLFLPTLVGGDGFRAAAAARVLPDGGTAFASVLLDRMFGFMALGVFGLIGALAAPAAAETMLANTEWRLPGRTVQLVIAGAGVVGLMLLARSARARRFASKTRDAARRLALEPRAAALALLLGFVVQGIYIVAWMVAARALDIRLPVSTFLFAVPLVTAGAMLPVSIGGLGLREGMWLILLSGAGVAPPRVLAFSLIFFASTLVVGAVGGILFGVVGTAPPPGVAAATDD